MTELDELLGSVQALAARIDHLEDRLDSIQHLATEGERMLNAASHLEQATHVTEGLEPRFELLEGAFEEISRTLSDINKMAEEVWDRGAISRRLAAIEDRLMTDEEEHGS
jgi:prefoldin subunit 5